RGTAAHSPHRALDQRVHEDRRRQPGGRLRLVDGRAILAERSCRRHALMLLTPRRSATRELGRAHARDRLATTEKRDVEVAGGDRAGGVVEEQLRTVAADGGALRRLAGLRAEILRDERG